MNLSEILLLLQFPNTSIAHFQSKKFPKLTYNCAFLNKKMPNVEADVVRNDIDLRL